MRCPIYHYIREQRVLQKDGFFRKREEKREDSLFRPSQAVATAPVVAAANADADATVPPVKATNERKEAKLVVGPDIKLKGVEISDCDTLIVEGRVEATLDSRVLEITPHGVFQGTIAVDNAEIHGRFEGELTVRKQLVIYGAGKVSGKIRYAKIKVEEGAELSGEISMLDKAQNAVRKAA
jgi:cytoskeletal protein CcmA (bactofilin family)